MLTAGVICEYNPFHPGHAWQLAQIRERTGAAAVICVMSGPFVQRGSFAILEEHARAEAAVACGADLVLALPVPWSAAAAERFAFGGVSLLEATGVCRYVCFGSESGDLPGLRAVSLALERPDVNAAIRSQLEKGLSYAVARERALLEQGVPQGRLLEQPNDTLAVAYLTALTRLGSRMTPVAIPRQGRRDGTQDGFPPAAALREQLLGGQEISAFLPEGSAAILRRELEAGRAPACMERAESAVLYRLRTMSREDFEALPDGGEGLCLRLMRCARQEPTVEAVLTAAKTKRYAMARLRRMVLCAYLGIRAGDAAGAPPYLRVLASNETGRALLHEMRQTASLPVVTKPAAARRLTGRAASILALEARAADLWALGVPEPEMRRGGDFWRAGPVICGKEAADE